MKEIILTIIFSLFCLTVAGQNNQKSTLLGDANGDGKVDVADIVEVVNYINNNPSSLLIFENADSNQDGLIDTKDVDAIKSIIMGHNYYSVLPLEDTSKWDYLFISTRGYYAAVKNIDNIRLYLIGQIGEKDLSKTITAIFNSDNCLTSMVIDNVTVHFIEDAEGVNYISYIENGSPKFTKYEDSSNQIRVASRSWDNSESGIKQSTTFQDIAHLISIVNLIRGIKNLASFLPSLENELLTDILKLDSSSDIPAEAKLTLTMVSSLIGAGITVATAATIATITPELLIALGIDLILSAVTNTLAYVEELVNNWKDVSYILEAGYTEIETLYPINIGNNKFKLGVRVSKSSSLPGTGKINTYGLLLKKEGDGTEDVNLYSKGTNICMEENLVRDGDFYVVVPDIEPGYKYLCRAFILPANEKKKNIIENVSLASNYFSYAYYGDIQEFKLDGPKRKLEYKQVSADNTNEEKVHFKTKVNVDIIDFSENIERWGIQLFKDDVEIDLDPYINLIYIRSGASTYNPAYNPAFWSGDIEFDAERETLTINEVLHQATTKDHWRIGTYVLYENGVDKRESIYIEPLDLVYSETPEAKTLDMSTATRVTSATVECEFCDFGLWEGKCGVEYWKEGGPHLEKFVEANQNGKYSIELTDLSPFTSYEYRAFVKVNDSYYRALETKDFVTQFCKPKYMGCEIIEKSFDYKNYHYKNKTYSYKFHIATNWEIETLDNIVDWGYKYIDLENKPDPISLMKFGKSYKDSRYAYYRNDRETEIKLLPYSKHGNSSARSRRSTTRNSDGDEDGYVYGDTVTIKLIYDNQPVATTFDPLSIAETQAKVKCGYKDAAPWEGVCGVEYWSDDNHLQKTIVNNADGEVEIELTNLLPNTTYQYKSFIKVESEYIWAEEIKSFTTKPVLTQLCPDDNHPHMIDLGLPSGTKWACCNVGASSPESNGHFYAWGDGTEKSEFDIDTYAYQEYSETAKTVICSYIGENISGTQFDIALQKWGSPWRMPSKEDFNELINNCEVFEVTYKGERGTLIVSPNGKQLFLKPQGYRDCCELHGTEQGVLWTSTYSHEPPIEAEWQKTIYAYAFLFYGDYLQVNGYHSRVYGYAIRPVTR